MMFLRSMTFSAYRKTWLRRFSDIMNLCPILEAGEPAKLGVWYVLSPEGCPPSARVGHGCVAITSSTEDGSKSSSQELYVIGGATPEGPFDDVHKLGIADENFHWTKVSTEKFSARYEHGTCAFLHSNSILVFGGARLDENLNDVQVLEIGKTTWESHTPEKDQPCPRTCHSVAMIGKKLYIFGGGHSGAMPVTDTHLYSFDSESMSWSRLQTEGESPLPRHGHVMAAINNSIFIHGGMEGVELYDDIYEIDIGVLRWKKLSPTGDIPSCRAAHAGTVIRDSIYIFGGMGKGGALDDLHRFQYDRLHWERISPDGCPPHPRLDHTLTAFRRAVKYTTTEGDNPEGSGQTATETLLFVFGGMDTRGEIFGDCCVLRVEES